MVTLSDGRQISPDMKKITIQEYRQLFAKDAEQDFEDEIMARVFNLSVKELLALPYPDYRLMVKSFFDAARDPVKTDPN